MLFFLIFKTFSQADCPNLQTVTFHLYFNVKTRDVTGYKKNMPNKPETWIKKVTGDLHGMEELE